MPTLTEEQKKRIDAALQKTAPLTRQKDAIMADLQKRWSPQWSSSRQKKEVAKAVNKIKAISDRQGRILDQIDHPQRRLALEIDLTQIKPIIIPTCLATAYSSVFVGLVLLGHWLTSASAWLVLLGIFGIVFIGSWVIFDLSSKGSERADVTLASACIAGAGTLAAIVYEGITELFQWPWWVGAVGVVIYSLLLTIFIKARM